MSEFCFNILTGKSVFWVTRIKFPNFFFNISNKYIWKTKHRSIIKIFYCNSARMISIISFGSENCMRNIISKENRPMKTRNFQVFNSISKKSVKNFCNFYIIIKWLTISSLMLPSVSRVSLCSINVIFSDDFILSESEGFTVRRCLRGQGYTSA